MPSTASIELFVPGLKHIKGRRMKLLGERYGMALDEETLTPWLERCLAKLCQRGYLDSIALNQVDVPVSQVRAVGKDPSKGIRSDELHIDLIDIEDLRCPPPHLRFDNESKELHRNGRLPLPKGGRNERRARTRINLGPLAGYKEVEPEMLTAIQAGLGDKLTLDPIGLIWT